MSHILGVSAETIANKPVAELTEQDIAHAVALIAADPRTQHVAHVERNLLDIRVTDTQRGELAGRYSLGRILNAMSETETQYRIRVQKIAEQRMQQAVEDRKVQQAAQDRAAENLTAMQRCGISLDALRAVRASMYRGRFVSEDQADLLDRFARLFGVAPSNVDFDRIIAYGSADLSRVHTGAV